jgi:hypothetical protein
MNLKGKFPFRLGATSYVIAGDIPTNVKFLSDRVDDVEIVVFESDELSELPDFKDIEYLSQTSTCNNLTYTIHLPLDIWLGEKDEVERQKSVGKCLRVIDRMKPLCPFGYVLHCNRNVKSTQSKIDLSCWQKNISQSIDELLVSGISPEMLCVETLDYPFCEIEPIIKEKNLSVCLDIGHILSNGFSVENYLHSYINQARIIHLHGILEGKDHCDISGLPPQILSMILNHAKRSDATKRVVCLEVFNSDALMQSLSILELIEK